MLMNVEDIKEYLPQRYPFLLVDRVVEMELGKSIVAYKNVTVNEPFFIGHFPGQPIMPGVLIIEALAQAAGVLGFKSQEKKPKDGYLYYFVGSTLSYASDGSGSRYLLEIRYSGTWNLLKNRFKSR